MLKKLSYKYIWSLRKVNLYFKMFQYKNAIKLTVTILL